MDAERASAQEERDGRGHGRRFGGLGEGHLQASHHQFGRAGWSRRHAGCASGCAHLPAQEAPRLPEQGQSAETRSPAERQPWPGEQDSKVARMEERALNPTVPGVGDVVSEQLEGATDEARTTQPATDRAAGGGRRTALRRADGDERRGERILCPGGRRKRHRSASRARRGSGLAARHLAYGGQLGRLRRPPGCRGDG